MLYQWRACFGGSDWEVALAVRAEGARHGKSGEELCGQREEWYKDPEAGVGLGVEEEYEIGGEM